MKTRRKNHPKFYEKLTNRIPNFDKKKIKNLNKNGIIKKGVYVKEKSILVGKIKIEKKTKKNILNIIFKKKIFKNSSYLTKKNEEGIIFNIKIIKKKLLSIILYLIKKNAIELGDKISGRHGNKGIVSKIIQEKKMPYLQDGTIIDMILNPLGIPSRMNIGQIFESIMGITGKNLKENYELIPFDEIYEKNLSIKMLHKKLYEVSIKSKKKWICDFNNLGKIKIIDGKTGKLYNETITVGYSYILKLIHTANEKIIGRSTATYSIVTKQPLKGKSKKGGQRIGEMEVWALEAFGTAFNLQELLTIKSDDYTNKYKVIFSLIENKKLPKPTVTETLKVFIIELQSIILNIEIYI